MPDAPTPPSRATSQPLVSRLSAAEKDPARAIGPDTDSFIDAAGQAHLLGQAQAALRESERRFRTLLNSVEAGVIAHAPDSTITAFNTKAVELFGVAEAQMAGRRVLQDGFDLLREDGSPMPADERPFARALARRQPTGPMIVGVRRAARDDLLWLLFNANPVLTPEGEVAEIIVTFMDVNARIAAEQALRTSEKRYKALFEQAAVGVAVSDAATGRYLQVNRRYCEIVGRSEAELLAITPAAITHPESGERDRELVRRLLAGELRDFTVEKRYLRKDGSIVPTSLTVSAMWAPGSPPDTMMAVVQDIAERKKAEARLRRLVETNAQSAFFWNTAGRITGANDAFLGLIGYTRDDLAAGQLSWLALTPPEYADLDRRALAAVAAKGFCEPYEKEYLRKDGSRIPIIIGAATFEDNPEEGVSYVVDLTERKRLEKQFLRAQRMESIGTLAGGIAHDLNNILTPIMMSIELLQDTAIDPETRRSLEAIQISARRGAEIVKQVLSFARGMDGARIEIQPRQLLADLETIIRHTLPKDIRLEFAVAEDPWSIVGDPTQMHQVLLNLCVNARDAMPAGGSLAVSVENCMLDAQHVAMNPDAQAGRHVLISVTDTGCGIPREIIDRIFEPFFTTKEINKSTGLGLSTVMAIVKSHHGSVNVYSEPGRGTTFKVYLPALDRAPAGSSAAPAAGSPPRGRGETILVVDDEASIRTVTGQILEAFGYRVVTAANGADGVAAYAAGRHTIKAVVTDMMMPVMGGLAMIHAIRRINPAVKVVASSGLTANHSAAELTETRIDQFLSKPYTADALLRALSAVFGRP